MLKNTNPGERAVRGEGGGDDEDEAGGDEEDGADDGGGGGGNDPAGVSNRAARNPRPVRR